MDDTATKRLTQQPVPNVPAFFGPNWNGWAVTALAVACIIAFFVTQTVIFVFVLLREHPEFIRYPSELMTQSKDPLFVVNFLTAKNLWVISVFSEATLALMTIGFAQVAFRATTANLGLTAPKRMSWVAVGIGAGFALFLISGMVEAVTTAIFGSHPQPQALALVKHHGLFDFALDLMSVSVAAPIAEEIFFRGFVFTGLVQRMSPLLAMTISAGFFALAHVEKWSFLPIFAIGFGLAWVYYNTRSLWVNIISHATINTISLVAAYLFPQLIK
ncbi:MAG TPA: type II CAAX endopeptidase family protein [Candidatus Eremiobacteraceae bacterium]|nr:type II CAAX endopeptidase family protein [Candidatus Eremiobacteraceae bacterium]